MTTWTLLLDESGAFEGGERVARIVGGVLCPGQGTELDKAWRGPLVAACEHAELRYPPHATACSPEQRAKLRQRASQLLLDAGGLWLFVVQAGLNGGDDLTTYARLLGETVDAAARVAGLRGATRLEIWTARRSAPIEPSERPRAERAGFDLDGDRFRVMVPGEVRQVFDALSREEPGQLPPRPALDQVKVEIATYGGSHPGLVCADLGCNYLYGRVRKAPDESLVMLVAGLEPVEAQGTATEAIVLPRAALARLRQLDRSLRRTPAALVDAAHEVGLLDSMARGNATALSPLRAAREGAARIAADLWSRGIACLSQAKPARLEELARVLAGQGEAQLAVRSGSYEGLWRALSDGWCGETLLARSVRSSCTDREVSAKLWRLSMEAANHRGDVAAASAAHHAFEEQLQGELSLSLLAERLTVQTLAVVMAQNGLPFAPDDASRVCEELVSGAAALAKIAEDASQLIALFEGLTAAPERVVSADELAIWTAAGVEPQWLRPDRGCGRLLGTAARSLAFAGRLDEARSSALRARTLFSAPLDLRFNAMVLARVELERCRLDPECDKALLLAALEFLNWQQQRKPHDVRERIESDLGQRFLLDIILRAVLWAPDLLDLPSQAWANALRAQGESSLLSLLSTGTRRSHPTELIARHAGELARRFGDEDTAQRWFALSSTLCEESADGTLRRFLVFTLGLATSPASVPVGPSGSVGNPTFEYR